MQGFKVLTAENSNSVKTVSWSLLLHCPPPCRVVSWAGGRCSQATDPLTTMHQGAQVNVQFGRGTNVVRSFYKKNIQKEPISRNVILLRSIRQNQLLGHAVWTLRHIDGSNDAFVGFNHETVVPFWVSIVAKFTDNFFSTICFSFRLLKSSVIFEVYFSPATTRAVYLGVGQDVPTRFRRSIRRFFGWESIISTERSTLVCR